MRAAQPPRQVQGQTRLPRLIGGMIEEGEVQQQRIARPLGAESLQFGRLRQIVAARRPQDVEPGRAGIVRAETIVVDDPGIRRVLGRVIGRE